jgi:purine-binding chemotaxis protein CheW
VKAFLGTYDPSRRALLIQARRWVCALPAASVVEVMRPLPVQPIEGAPRFVRGLAIIRGAPVAVVDLAALLGAGSGERGARFVTARAGPRTVALEVSAVLGFEALDASALHALPPLLSEALPDQVQKLGALDGHTLALLDVLRILPGAELRAPAPEGGP